jgi:multiple sugar transport system substrate-binding protein
MMRSRARWATAGLAVTALTGLTACSSTEAPAGPAEAEGPVTIEIWGWNAETGEQIDDAINEAQDDVEVKYVLQASNVATQTNFQNAMEAGSGVPCLVQGFAPLTTMVVNGWAQDITEQVEGSADLYNEGALAAAQVDGRYYGLPSGSDGQFYIVNQKTFDKYDVEVPTTWDEFVDAGRELKPHGVDITNLAGEDPSSLMNLARRAPSGSPSTATSGWSTSPMTARWPRPTCSSSSSTRTWSRTRPTWTSPHFSSTSTRARWRP